MMTIHTFTETVLEHLHPVIYGKDEEIRRLLAAYLAGGHILLEDVPGTGKTTLAKGFANVLNLQFSRVQCTPDLLPSDLTGTTVPDPTNGKFILRKGPIFTGLLLADELNRTSPRTQSALLEAMAERQVTIDGTTYPLDSNFTVIATQNPIETAGTYPLPEAQLDRFLTCMQLGYLTEEEELALMERKETVKAEPIPSDFSLSGMQKELQVCHVSNEVKQYILHYVTATRNHPALQLGLSTRATLDLLTYCKAYACICGSTFVTPDHVLTVAVDCTAHRLIRNDWENKLQAKREIATEILHTIPIP